MINYYFISSPFHLFLSCNLAIENSQDENIAIVVPKITKSSNLSDTYTRMLSNATGIFTDFVSFERININQPLRSKYSERKFRFQQLKKLLQEKSVDRIYTGNDRRVEFQYSMLIAKRNNSKLEGIYLDEGMATYLGHKSMHSIQHRYIDPFLKKIFYGWWWKNPITIGSSSWIDKIYAAFPNFIHPSLLNKNILSINHDHFSNHTFTDFCKKINFENGINIKEVEGYKLLIVLTHESFYPNGYSHIKDLINKAKQFVKEGAIAIKAHPRSECFDNIKSDFPDCKHVSHRIGFEMLLPILSSDCMVVGDVSTAVFTTRWLRPKLSVIAVKIEDEKRAFIHQELSELYKKIEVPLVSMNGNWFTK